MRLARNGFDPVPSTPAPSIALSEPDDTTAGTLTIVYAGVLYGGKRDPGPLFAAAALLDETERGRLRIHFFGSDRSTVESMAATHG